MTTYQEICKFRIGDKVKTIEGYGYDLYTNGLLTFTRHQVSGVVLPATSDTNISCDPFGTVYISIAPGIKAAVNLDGLELIK